jgi:hypothetical protein
MANNIGPDLLSPQLWSPRMQILLKKNLVAGAIANTEERATLTYGYRVHRPYHGDVYAQTYTKGTVPSFQDMTATDEYLDVDQAKIIPLFIDDIDSVQNKYDALNKYTTRSSYRMKDSIDKKFLAVLAAGAALGNSSAVSLDTTNVVKYTSESKAALFNNGTEEDAPWYMVVDGDTVSTIEQTLNFAGFKVSDDTLVNGYGLGAYLGDWQGLKMFKSQNLPSTVSIVFSDDPTATKTLIINGVTFTFVASLGTTPGNVLIDGGSAVDVTIGTNLVAAINNGTAGTTYYQLSAADRAKLENANVVASYVAGTNTLTLTAAGKMVIGGDQDTGTVGTQTMKLLVGKIGGGDLVIQKEPSLEILRATDGRRGYIATTLALYGAKVFNEGAQRTYALTVNK